MLGKIKIFHTVTVHEYESAPIIIFVAEGFISGPEAES